MQKIKIVLIILVSMLMMTGCASMGGIDKDSMVPAGTMLISPQATAIDKGMSESDKAKLLQLVSSARADETASWGTYEFKSLNVFVNSSGQACREYRVKAGLFGDKQSQQVACRNSRGVWKVKA